MQNGRSLLPAGITHTQRRFGRGDTISILGQSQTELARGIARYNSHDMVLIAGCQSDQIEQKLGYAYGSVAVYRNDLIIL